MRIAILGSGAEGSGLAGLLTSEPDVEEIRFGDVDEAALERAKERVESLGGKTAIQTEIVNACEPDSVASWARGCDVVVNATMPDCNLPAMRGCLAARTHYMDFNGGPFEIEGVIPQEQTIDAQFGLHEAFRDIDRVAISCAGVAPGWVDVVARYISETLDDKLKSVTVRWVDWSDATDLITTVGPALIANFNMPRPICWEDGQVVPVDLFESEETYKWPEPVGEARQYTGFLHPELRTIQNIGREIGRIEVKSGLSNGPWKSSQMVWIEALRRQLDEGAAVDVADLPKRLGKSFIPPEEYPRAIEKGIVTKGAFCVSVEVCGTRGEQDVKHTVYLKVLLEEARERIPWGTHMVYATSGTTPVILTTMLGRGRVPDRGVVGVGGLSCWREVLDSVQDRGHHMTEKIEVEGPLAL